MEYIALYLRLFTLTIIAFGLAACGGGSSTNESTDTSSIFNTPASVNSENSEGLAEAAIIAAESSLLDTSEFNNPFASSNAKPVVIEAQKISFEQLKQGSLKPRETVPCALSGSITVDIPSSSINGNQLANSGTFNVIFNMCRNDVSTTIDGTLRTTWSGGLNSTGEPRNATIDVDVILLPSGENYTGVIECTNFFAMCDDTRVLEEDGVTYEITDVTVMGNSLNGYDISARIAHENYGYIFVTGDNLIPCDNGGFSSGTMSILDGSEQVVLQIDFLNCSEFDLTFNGETITLIQ